MSKTVESDKKVLVPRLRFPEFQEAGEWKIKNLGDKDISSFVKKRLPLSDLVLDSYVSTENILPDFAGKKGASKLPPSGSFTSYKPGDILIANIRPYLKKIWVADSKGAASNDVIVVRPMGGVEKPFLSSLLKSDSFIDHVMKGAKGVKMPRGDVSLMKEYTLAVPGSEEQQKIANCLSSLDALIAAQVEKIDALLIHKKGLMQQLFPRVGETVPRLRFPEFRDAGEWAVKTLGELVDVIDGDRGVNYPKSDEFSKSGFCLFLSAKNVTKNGFKFSELQFIEKSKDEALRKGKLKRNDVVLTTRGSVGQFAYFSEDIPYDNIRINSGMVILRVSSTLATDYLYASSKSAPLTTHIENMAFGNAQQQLTVAGIKKLPVYYPEPEEQQKVADCLSSLDALIAAQTEKLDALKAHKKGLMQQLFPSLENLKL
ncbi:MAG: restriction endonuclease subunit S [Pseudomonadales bacterium]|nr:restriction endonuclease subunit S [Pseudomonadales bacterium]